MSQNADQASMQQRAMIITLALIEKGRGSMSYPLPLQVTKEFWKEILCVSRWQSANQDSLNQIVAWGWIKESVAGHGTIFYSLTDSGRYTAEQAIIFASRNAFEFVPQSRSLFDLLQEN